MEQSHHHQPPSPATAFHHHHHQEQQQQHQIPQPHFPKEDMFEKQLTPSDVGKLNRLVIPKQHAEKYFPISGDSGDQQKGLVLTFEDESGKLWRFRYSYWNSSQSYVLTKGWSRYVKDKRLDAGDVVVFQRHLFDCERLFIGWRRRFAVVPVAEHDAVAVAVAQPSGCLSDHLPLGLSLPYQPTSLHAVEVYENMESNCQRGVVSTRRLRLFGVNLECQDSEPSDPYGSSHDHHESDQYNFSSNQLHLNMVPVAPLQRPDEMQPNNSRMHNSSSYEDMMTEQGNSDDDYMEL